MSRLLLAAAVAAGVLASADAGRAQNPPFGPHATSVTWPSVTPPGWYTNTYNYMWYIPWYANYDYTQGPYANWMVGGGYAGYASHGSAGMYYSSKPPTQPYLGEWAGGMSQSTVAGGQSGTGAYGTLQGLTGCPAPQPGDSKTPKTDPKKDPKTDSKKDSKQ